MSGEGGGGEGGGGGRGGGGEGGMEGNHSAELAAMQRQRHRRQFQCGVAIINY